MAETSLAIRTGGQLISSYDEAERAAKAMAASGFFADSRNAAQAVVKILAGQEMGFGPFASMNGVYIISGRPSIGANLMAAAVKKSGRYNYQIAEMTEKACSITFFENGKEIGVSTFTAEDARKAGTKNMDKYARNMLFARAMSNGVRWYCPDVFNGSTVYTPEELGANVNEDGEVIDLPVTETTPAPTNGKAQPAPAHVVIDQSDAGLEGVEQPAPERTTAVPVGIVPPAQRPTPKMMATWSELINQAEAVGLPRPDPIEPNKITAQQLAERGKALRAQIAEIEHANGLDS